MNKEKLIEMIRSYGDACEAYGDFQSQENGQYALSLERDIIKEIEKIFSEKA